MRVVCRYSPQLVCGVPALVLDPFTDPQGDRFLLKDEVVKKMQSGGDTEKAISQRLVNDRRGRIQQMALLSDAPSGTHYVGKVARVQHVLHGSGGAQTIVTLVNCREHREGANLFMKPGDEDRDGKVTIQKSKRVYSRKRVKPASGTSFLAKYTDSVIGKGGPGTMSAGKNGSEVENFIPVKGRKYLVRHKKGSDGKLVEAKDGKVEVDIYKITSTRKKYNVTFSFEATATPPWFSNIYQPDKIGTDFYGPMFGCASVLDNPPLQLSDEAQAKFDEVEAVALKQSTKDQKKVVTTTWVEIPSADGNAAQEVQVPASFVRASYTTQNAADKLSEVYLGLKRLDVNMDLFIDMYTSRKYATMLDIMGNMNEDLILSQTISTSSALNRGDTRFENQVGMREEIRGFHGFAYGDQENLAELEYEPLPQLTGVKNIPNKRNPDGKVDPRKTRYQRVLAYRKQVASRGQG